MSVTNPDQSQAIVLNITMKYATGSDVSSHGMQIRNSLS